MNPTTRRFYKLSMIVTVVAFTPSSLRAELRLAVPEVDLGEVRAGVRLTREVAIRNDAVTSAEILEVRGSCGCVSPRVEPRVIPPGGSAILHLSINTLGEGAGPHAWKVAIRYRQAAEIKDLELSLRAKIVTEITIQPASLTLVTEGGLTQAVLLTDLRAVPLKITRVAASSDFLIARLAGQGPPAKIQLEVRRELPPGRHVEALTIYTDDPIYGELRVPVTIVKPAARAVIVDPPEVRLDPATGVSSQMVRIRSRDGQPIQIEKIQPAHAAIRCKWAAGDGGDMFVRIEADAVPAGVSRSRVDVHLTAPVREVIAIPVLLGDCERETQAVNP